MITITTGPGPANRRRRRAMRSCAALAALVTIAGVAQADAKPLERGTFHDVGSEPFLDEHGDPVCLGLDVVVSWDVRGSYLGVARGPDRLAYFRDSVRGMAAWTNVATGKSYTLLFARNSRDLSVRDNGDGTLTIIGQGSGGDRWYDGNGQLVLRDPGMVRFEVLIDHAGTPADPFDDEFLEFVGIVKESTGLNETHGRDFCEDIALFTT